MRARRPGRVALAVLGAIGLFAGLTLQARARTARRYEARLAELRALAVPSDTWRRPWELDLEDLVLRTRERPGFPPEPRPLLPWGGAEPVDLDTAQMQWLARLEVELEGLDHVLAALRGEALADLHWNGSTLRLLFAREPVNLLCGRAWSRHDAEPLVDALHLARAGDDGTFVGGMVRLACEDMVLHTVRAGLASGRFEAGRTRDALAPQLADWGDATAGEYRLRRELSGVDDLLAGYRLLADDAGWFTDWQLQDGILQELAPVEEALRIARLPAGESPWIQGGVQAATVGREVAPAVPSPWCIGTFLAHERHSRRNVFLTGLAVAAFREETGRWPGGLEEVAGLAAGDALDPVTGEPLEYAAGADGARVGPARWGVLARPGDYRVDPYVWELR